MLRIACAVAAITIASSLNVRRDIPILGTIYGSMVEAIGTAKHASASRTKIQTT
jgi:hypothetical protein